MKHESQQFNQKILPHKVNFQKYQQRACHSNPSEDEAKYLFLKRVMYKETILV